MKKLIIEILKKLALIGESILVGAIVFFIMIIACSSYASFLESSGGTVLASELVELKYAPYLIGIFAAIGYFLYKNEKP